MAAVAPARTPSPPLNYDYSIVTTDTDQAATLLLDAKNEYHKQLTSHLRQPVFNLMKSIYNSSEDICHQENTPENVLMVFQDNLAQVPKWNKQRRNKEYDNFLKVSKCDWFNELIKFTYVTHVKILTIVNKPRPDVKLSISIPSGGIFFHSVCINVARELWRSPFLFSKHVGGKYEYQKNMRQIEQIIDNSVDSCIRTHIPMKTILQEYMDSDLTVPTPAKPQSTPTTEQITSQQSLNTVSNSAHNTPEVKSQPITKELFTNTETQKPEILQPSTSRNKKLEIDTDDSLEDFINTPTPTSTTESVSVESSKQPSQPTDTNKTTAKPDNLDAEEELESVNFAHPDEMVDELDIIETAIEDTPETEITDLPEIVLSQQPSTAATPEPTTVPEKPNQKIPDTTLDTTQDMTPDMTNSEANINNNPVPAKKTLMSSSTVKTNPIEEFDIDTLPELNLESLTKLAEPDKPTTPEPITETATTSAHAPSNFKHIPLTDMNEPGMAFVEELKQPTPAKKKLIIEDADLLTDDLDEVPLAAKVEELRTIKRPEPQPTKTTPVNKQNFAFF